MLNASLINCCLNFSLIKREKKNSISSVPIEEFTSQTTLEMEKTNYQWNVFERFKVAFVYLS